MERFTDFNGLAVPYVHDNIDTDTIIPKQFLTSVTKTGYGLFLFNDARWLNPATDSNATAADLRPNPDFALNQPRYAGAEVLVSGHNFGCGSSREHAVWALLGFGFKAVIAQSFADIFASNSSKNGLLLISQPREVIDGLTRSCGAKEGFSVAVNLSPDEPCIEFDGNRHGFEINSGVKERLLAGLDEIGITEQLTASIQDYEERRRQAEPWLEIGAQQ